MLVSKKGHFRQVITRDGKQEEHPDPWEPAEHMQLLYTKVKVQIQKRDVYIKPWLYTVKSQTGGVVPVYFTPLRPLEASGTSGMKAAHNGVINFSILDGW